jgi:hypothetical protein
MVYLKYDYFGYTQGELTGKQLPDYRYEIKLSSGKLIYLWDDEFEKA